MFKQIIGKVKNYIGESGPFSSLSIFPFSKYKTNFSKQDFLNAYKISLYVNRALNKRAEKVGNIEFILKKGDQVVDNNEILDLLAKPNNLLNGNAFWALYQKYIDIYGEVYIMTDNELMMGGKSRVTRMDLLRSDLCTPYFDKDLGDLIYVEYRNAEKTVRIPSDNMIYIHVADPENPARGESLIASGIRQIDTSIQIDEYQSKVLENGGRVEGVFTFKTGKLSKKQLTELKEQFQEEYGNASKSGLPLFLSGEAQYNKLAMTPEEMAYLETKKVCLNDIVVLTGVPKALLGSVSDETYSNSSNAKKIFLEEVIDPLCKNLVNALDEKLIPEEFTLTYVDMTPEDRDSTRKDIENGMKNYYMTPNEARELMGLEPIAGGDEVLVPFNMSPMGTNSDTQVTPEASKKKSNIDIHNNSYHPLRDKENRLIYHALQVKRLDNRQKRMIDVINSYFDGQKQRIVESLEARKQFKTKDLLGEIFRSSVEVALAKETVLPILYELLKESAIDAKEIAGSDWEFNDTAEIQSWLDKKTTIFAQTINDTTFKKLKKEFEISFNENETRKQLIDRIEDTYKTIKTSRAETIARTEVHGVTQYGTMEGYKQAGMQIKIWVWAPGTKGGTRDEHQAMDGEERPIDTAFSNGLMFPGSSGPADEVINCQCFI